MPTQEWTAERRAAFGAKMKAAKAAKENNEQAQPTETTTPPKAQESVTITKEQFDSLMARLDKVDNKPATQTSQSNNGFDQYGKPTGVIQRYVLDPSHYADPVEKLYDISELKKEALRENYVIDWNVDQIVYETKYGTSMADPKFTLILKRKIYDGSELTDRRIIVQTGVFFEDPAASVKEAMSLGLPIDNANTPQFLEQMRFLRYKQWLMDIFNPQLPKSTKASITEHVMNGKVYRIEDSSVVV